MKKEKNIINKISEIPANPMVTSPISQEKLVSKVNSLTLSNCANSIGNPQNKVFNNERYLTLNYKMVVEEIVNASNITSAYDFYNVIYSIITENINSEFMSVGLFKEKSNCINLKLKDKLGNFYCTKVFLKETDNPIVQAFTERKIVFKDDVKFLKLSYFKNQAVAILPLISVNKCIGVLIIEDSYARQNIGLYKLIANYTAMVTHNFDLLEMSEEYVNTDNLTLLYNHRSSKRYYQMKLTEQN